jgi:hypothetical protein
VSAICSPAGDVLFRADDKAHLNALVDNDPLTPTGGIAATDSEEWQPVIGPCCSSCSWLTRRLRTGRPLRKSRRRAGRPPGPVHPARAGDRRAPGPVEDRGRVGDSEGDLIVGPRSRLAIDTLVSKPRERSLIHRIATLISWVGTLDIYTSTARAREEAAMSDEAAEAGTDVARQLIAFADDWAVAITANDAERIGRFMAEDWVIVSESGVTPASSSSP